MKKEHKIIAMYLPQYHTIPENNLWWGEGFTDWQATQNAEKLYSTHEQPKIPLNNNYYDLSDKNTLRWQASLMNKYGIDGLCFYHYCFSDNKLLLEKPAEILLKNSDINMPFCFCWANESWVRSWSNIENSNVWSHKYENKNFFEKTYLIEQRYGDEKQWEVHFQYLLPFFRDKRYIIVNNKPVFFIYKTDIIDCLKDMKQCWDRLAKESGFDGIYLIGGNSAQQYSDYLDAYYLHEPLNTKNMMAVQEKKKNLPVIIDYDDIWRGILSHLPKKIKTFFGGFVGYDDTPRHEVKGAIVCNNTPEKFGMYLAELIAKNVVYDNEHHFTDFEYD